MIPLIFFNELAVVQNHGKQKYWLFWICLTLALLEIPAWSSVMWLRIKGFTFKRIHAYPPLSSHACPWERNYGTDSFCERNSETHFGNSIREHILGSQFGDEFWRKKEITKDMKQTPRARGNLPFPLQEFAGRRAAMVLSAESFWSKACDLIRC